MWQNCVLSSSYGMLWHSICNLKTNISFLFLVFFSYGIFKSVSSSEGDFELIYYIFIEKKIQETSHLME